MPYIPKDERREIDGIVSLTWIGDLDAGSFNYLISSLLNEFLKDLSYERLNTAIGVLECAKLELYRRVAAPYEDLKRDINGEVYGHVIYSE